MDLLTRLGYRPPRTQRRLTAEQAAELDIEEYIFESRMHYDEMLQESQACARDADRARAESQQAQQRRHRDYPQTSLTTAWGVLALLAMAANWVLETLLFTSMDLALPFAALVATVSTAAFAGLGAMALHQLRGGAADKVLGALLLAGLAGVALVLVPVLAHARADEMYGDKIREARNRVEVTRSLTNNTRGARLDAAAAQQEVPVLINQQATAEKVFTAVLAMTLFTEVALAGYAFDLRTRRRATKLQRRATDLEEAADEARNEAAAQDNEIHAELTDIARRHALPLATVESLFDARTAALTTRAAAPPTPRATTPAAATSTAPGGDVIDIGGARANAHHTTWTGPGVETTPSHASQPEGSQPGSSLTVVDPYIDDGLLA